MPRPFLSILIDTYNHEKYIEQAVVSAIEQDFPARDYEIVVVDDGSTDRTPNIVRKFAPRVRLLRKKNGGQASAFNAAIPGLGGEAVAFLDGDDWWVRAKLSTVANALDQHPEAAAVGHGYFEFQGSESAAVARTVADPRLVSLASPEAAREARASWHCFLTSALTVRSDMLRRCIPLPDRLRFCADAPFAIGAMVQGAWVLASPLSYYRQHATNLFSLKPQNKAGLRRKWAMAWRAFDELGPILTRLGGKPDCVSAFLHSWAEVIRSESRREGGHRFNTFQTELRLFQIEHGSPRIPYKIFKYLFVGGATLLLSPNQFYAARDWYARGNLGRVRERLLGSR